MMAEPKKVAIVQSSYIPWRGYFDMIAKADLFVLYDVVQYTKRDWRNRNKIKTAAGDKWLTIPVRTSHRQFQRINQAEVVPAIWADKHLKSFEVNYRKARYFDQTMEWLVPLYSDLKEQRQLSIINKSLIKALCQQLSISTPIIEAEDFQIIGHRSQALLSILQQIEGVTHYISGPAAKAYLDEELFNNQNIKVDWMDYADYPIYDQLFPPFSPKVSIVDLLFNEGPNSRYYLKRQSPK
jgi:hypothetical protein